MVRTDSGELLAATARSKAQNAIVGDRVNCSLVDPDNVCIEQVEPRSSALERLDRRGRSRILASNFDCMIIVSAPAPGIDRLMIDQYLVAAEDAGVNAVVLINKADLLTAADRGNLEKSFACYRNCGYEWILCSAHDAASLAPLHRTVSERACVFVGQSGVGKSSLIQHAVPEQDIAVGALSRAGLGSHTTIAAYWYETPGGGAVIDSPGVREFRVDHLNPHQIAAGFRDIADAAADCRFSNCSHRHEPNCAVKTAVESGALDATRHRNFVAMMTDSERVNSQH